MTIRNIITRIMNPFTVVCDTWIEGRVIVHRARTFTEALEWAACYDREELVIIRRRGVMVAYR